MTDESTVIARLRKSKAEDLVVRLGDFRGMPCVDVRVFADFDGTSGDRRPTRKGVAFRAALLPEVIEALQKAEAEARRRGAIPGRATP